MTPKGTRPHVIVPVLLVIALVAALAAAAYWYFFRSGRLGSDSYSGAVYTVSRRDLVINVLEGGSLQSANAHELKSEVEGSNTIISLLPEGTILTEEDVKQRRILAEFDSSALTEKEAQQQITFQGAQADYIQAKESFEIQEKQNESNITAGQLTVKFARMDLERYLGAALAASVLAEKVKLSVLTLDGDKLDQADKALDALGLGGAARKEWQKLQSDIDLAEEKVKRAYTDYTWSLTLGPKDPNDPASNGKGYISQSDVDADKLKWQAAVAETAQTKLAKDIFLRYDLPKQAEKLNSDYAEALRELDRIHAKARAELAQAESQMKSKEASFRLQTTRLNKLREQIKNCTIVATRPGMLVYTSTADRRGRQEDVIELGAQVRERQVLFRIPDSSSMTLLVHVNEASINKVQLGQNVRIVAEPFPEQAMQGTVTKVSSTPDPQQRWLAPDTQTYTTEITISKPPTNLRPGMSAKAEIIVDQLDHVVAVPIQSVSMLKGVRICYTIDNGRVQAQPVEIGQANNSFIEIKSGLAEGDNVLLTKPATADESLVTTLAEKMKSEAAAEDRKAATQRQSAAAKTPSEAQESDEPTAPEALPDYIQQAPEQYRQRLIERRNAVPMAERAEFDRKARANHATGKNSGQGPRHGLFLKTASAAPRNSVCGPFQGPFPPQAGY